jgi:DUF4097 and DUF4098 domain-containing protein YvlB
MIKMPKQALIVFAGIVFLTLPACALAITAEGSFERTLSVSGPVDLDVTTGSGNIRVVAAKTAAIRVRGIIRARDDFNLRGEEKVRYLESHPPIEQNGNIIKIGYIQEREYSQNVSISYELEVPAETHLTSRTGSGNQSIDGIQGPVDATTGSGNVNASNIANQLRAKTGSGNIELNSISSNVQAGTGSGEIRASRIGGAFKGDTGSGNILLNQTAPGDVELRTGSGSLEASGVRGALLASSGSGSITAAGEPSGEWKINCSSGNITLRLAQNAGFELAARTSSGRIDLGQPVTVSGRISPKEIHGKVRGGGPLVDLHTSSGNISIQ